MLEVVTDTVQHLWEGYLWCLSFSDKRTQGWLLMGSWTPTWILTFTYLFIVYIGPKIMKDREPFQLKSALTVYNFALVALNFHIFWELFYNAYTLKYSLSCQLVHYGDNPNELRIAKAVWWYYFSKCVEFLDTVFFIMRKKNNQISFLHVYHHASMFPIWWIGANFVPGGQSFFGAMINSGIHVLMYTYYGIAGLGPQFQKFLWWKRYLTTLQLIQFIVGMVHAANSLYVGCPFPLWMQYSLIAYGMSILGLFLNFYYHEYIKKSKARSSKQSTSTNGHTVKNGHSVDSINGHTTNGTREMKKSK